MNKIEINEQGVLINNTPIKLRFGLSVLQKFADDHKYTSDHVLIHMPDCLRDRLLNVVDLLYDTLVYCCKRENVPLEFTWDDVEAYVTDNPSLRIAIMQVWENQLPPPVDEKKKEGEPMIEQS